MDNLSYTTGHFNDFVFPASDGGSGIDDLHTYQDGAYPHEDSADQYVLSPVIELRHDSACCLSPLQQSGFQTVQYHKADFQPGSSNLTPHLNTDWNRSEDMSRQTSHASHQSSMSGSHRYHGGQQAQGYRSDILPGGIEMRRTVSLYADIANQNSRSLPVHHRVRSSHLNLGVPHVYPSVSSIGFLDDTPYNAPLDDSIIERLSSGTTHGSFEEFGVGSFDPE